ncbi:MAG: sarcosine oxidase subunit alpha family protein [Rhodobacteraceae bacterium]|nr:sarcosine oxidase subunit alpha family protein [Paracoccaceae bacterium]
MTQTHRIKGGLTDRDKTLSFVFDGKKYEAHPGDTLASALLANGQKMVARSFKYHRPRGIFSAGSEEPNALVTLGRGAFKDPNTRATTVEVFDGLQAASQNYRGSLKFDFMAITDLLSPFLSAGFYYKTFMWPRAFWEKLYEPVIRASAGLGRLSGEDDPDTYDRGFLHCDLLIIGAGPAGLSAALTAGRAGAEVILADEDFRMGGRLLAETYEVDGLKGVDWVARAVGELGEMENVRLMPRTSVYGAYDHGIYGLHERVSDHLPAKTATPRQILWKAYSRQAILCAGATERPIAFPNNDRPGIMLAGAVRAYVNRWGVTSGKRIAVFTNNDDGWRTARDLAAKGINIAAIIDSREQAPLPAPDGVMVAMGTEVINTKGRHGLRSITLSNGQRVSVDCLAVSGGWSPNVHLTCHQRGRPVWRDDIAAFVPGDGLPPGMSVAGAASGTLPLGAIMAEGQATAYAALERLGFEPVQMEPPVAENEAVNISPHWHVKSGKGRAWLDLQNDVTVKDVQQAYREGFRSVEHMKRYTTLGMATDQGKTSNIPAMAVMAECTGKTIAETGTTMFRPPYSPIPIAAFAGRSKGRSFRPTRLTPSHKWAEERGAVFTESGLWLRAQWFPQEGEVFWRDSVNREVLQTRASVGVCDVTTLGKIDIQGLDAADFINKVYTNGFAKLPVGKVRYGLMLREDGMVMDDGTTARLSQNHFVMTTTTANAGAVFRHLEFCHQCLWPDMDVNLISVTDQYAQYAVAGPNARKLLQKLVDPAFDISNTAFPFMACAEITIADGIPARLFRISFSGELAYEISVAARFGDSLIRALMQAGKAYDVVPYGTEALGVMRVEKGHVAGNELNGQTTARDLGMEKMLSKQKDFIGKTLSERSGLLAADRMSLIGIRPVDRDKFLTAGAHFMTKGEEVNMANDQGWISSVAYSPSLEHSIGLGFLKSGEMRMGEIICATDPLRGVDIDVEVVSPHFLDPKGERLRA